MVRHEFALKSPVKRATVYMSGLGYSELYLNGAKIGDHVLDPILRDYDKHVPYVTYEVTEQLKQGKNALGVLLGNGRFVAPRPGARTFGYPKLRMELHVELADGSQETILSDPSWKLTTEGPIRENNDYDGEIYDARLEQAGWSEGRLRRFEVAGRPGGRCPGRRALGAHDALDAGDRDPQADRADQPQAGRLGF